VARLEAIAKGLYYPTPSTVLGLIAKIVCIPFAKGGSLFDPCAGEGHAAAFLAEWWGLRALGIELDGERAAEAAKRCDVVHRGSYHQLSVDPERAFSVLLLNPPYDDDAQEDDVSMRQEVVFLRATAERLVHEGLLIYIVPRRILASEKLQELLGRYFRAIRVYRFPDPEVRQFDQVVLFARRHCPTPGPYSSYGGYGYYGDLSVLKGDLPTLGDEPYGDEESSPIPSAPELKKFRLIGRPPEELAPSIDPSAPTGAYASTRWALLTSEAAVMTSAPLVAPRPGHQAMLLAAGRLNGCVIDGFVMKGGSTKITTSIENEKESVEREQIVSHMSALSLATGELDTWRVDQDPVKTAEWFQKNGESLARAILEGHAPSFDGDLSRYDFSGLRAPGVLPGCSEPQLLEVQKEAAAATVHRWRGHKTTILCGEQGTGKTTMAIVATSLARSIRNSSMAKVIVVCPSHLVPKWIRECKTITGQPWVARTAKRVSEVDAFFADPNARYLILSKEMAKLGCRWRPSFSVRKRIVMHERTVREGPYSWSPAHLEVTRTVVSHVACPACGSSQIYVGGLLTPMDVDQKVRRNCQKCEGPLWTSVPLNERGTKRWPLARHINRHYAGRFSLVIDECHQHSGSESDQGRAVHMLAVAAVKILAMTGTLYGGRASSIFHLLYRIDHSFREQYRHDECAKFVQHHGLFETVYETEERTSVYNYRKGRSGGRVREIPGMSPAMIPMLLPYCIFVKLNDMGLNLPPYSEEVEVVSHDPKVEAEARKLADGVRTALMKHPQALGQYLNACLGYPDRPDQSEEIIVDTKEGSAHLASAIAFPDQLWPKDVRVAEICREEVDAGRRCLVYFAQTHRRDARGRVRRALEEKGLRVAVLDSNVAPEKREEWLREADEEGFDVLLTNGRLVETGMDLLFANTIIQYGIEYSLSTLRQSIRRSWRLGQTLPVRVIFMAYRNTMQHTAIDLIARKMRAAEMVDGDAAGGLAQHDVGGSNFLVELAHEAISTQASLRPRERSSRDFLDAFAE
jgi:superfamily II DNA or RNA helicase